MAIAFDGAGSGSGLPTRREKWGTVTLYRILLMLSAPLLVVVFLWRWLLGRETGASLAERLGAAPAASEAPQDETSDRNTVIWLHGASNGELTSVRPLAMTLLDLSPGLRLVVTANTTTGRALAESWQMDRITAAMAPLDFRLTTRRFLNRTQTQGLLVVENELWPNRIDLLAMAGKPVVVVGARMSEGSAARWGRYPKVAAGLIGRLSGVSSQDDASARRYLGLGLPRGAMLPPLDLKRFAGPAPATDVQDAQRRAKTVLAASTHEGEEAVVLDAFAPLWRADSEWRLILAPRHPRRGPEIAALVAAMGLPLHRRTDGALPEDAKAVFLADTMGEMPRWYARAPVTFVGGSLTDRGGHTPYEPAAFRSAVLHGPFLSNFAEPYSRLASADAAVRVTNAPSLQAGFALAADLDAAAELAAKAHDALAVIDTKALADLTRAVAQVLNLRTADIPPEPQGQNTTGAQFSTS